MEPLAGTANAFYLFLEACLTLLAILAAIAFPRFGDRWLSAIERLGGRIAERRWSVVLVIGCAAPIIRLLLLPLAPVPEPAVHDEFSYLLAADTFASGRLTNPTHPMWIHFETFHESFQPTYMSMYFPVQGMILAAGKVVLGHPWFGVCASVGFMCAAICWALQGWLPAGWALLGSILVLVRIALPTYWMNSYWGGAPASIGGALVLGALPRLMDRGGARHAVVLGLGLGILGNSRPFESVLLLGGITIAYLVTLRKRYSIGGLFSRRILLPFAGICVVTAASMGYYNWRVFGNPMILPYQLNRATYAVSPVFIWESPRPAPAYRHAVLRKFYTAVELRVFESARSASGFVKAAVRKFAVVIFFFYGFVLALPLLWLPSVFRSRRGRFLLVAAGIFFTGILGNAFISPHYLSPATALLFVILVYAMRWMRRWRPGGEPAGRFLVRAIPAVSLGLCALHLALAPVSRAGIPRANVQRMLDGLPGQHLAIVRYKPDHDPLAVEWVYNTADIDHSKVIWAREMSPAEDRKLLDYFGGRTAWLVEADNVPPRVTRYPRP